MRKKMKLLTGMLLCMSATSLVSCAIDGFDEEEFIPSVTNTTMESPSAEDITVTSSADGKSQTITWPVVHGAGGFAVSFWNADTPETPIVADSIVDGCSVTVPREEDMNYVFSIKTLGNALANNSDAEAATEYAFTTFMPATAVIPAGTDIFEWSQTADIQALLQTPTDETLIFDLEAGGEYTLSAIV
ncbi:MAG: DUF4992 family lipoprotein, partial [Prevotella sp.]|nr:DUF4992 family lipoprotein [Prevotella sp.]